MFSNDFVTGYAAIAYLILKEAQIADNKYMIILNYINYNFNLFSVFFQVHNIPTKYHTEFFQIFSCLIKICLLKIISNFDPKDLATFKQKKTPN